MTTNKINQELNHFLSDPPTGCSVEVIDKKTWHGTIVGPAKTPYANGSFIVEIKFTKNFPFHVPQVKMITPIFHFNFSRKNGKVCLGIFDNEWDKDRHIYDIMKEIRDVMIEPSISDVLEIELADLYLDNETIYQDIAAKWSIKWAKGDGGGFLIKQATYDIKKQFDGEYDPDTHVPQKPREKKKRGGKNRRSKKKNRDSNKNSNTLDPNNINNTNSGADNNDDSKEQSASDYDTSDNNQTENENDNDNETQSQNQTDNKEDDGIMKAADSIAAN